MKLQLEISRNEVLDYQRDYREHIRAFQCVRQSELAWVTNQIVNALSNATSQKGGWAVSDTIKPVVAHGLSSFNLSAEPAKVQRKANSPEASAAA